VLTPNQKVNALSVVLHRKVLH